MRKTILTLSLLGTAALAGCMDTYQERQAGGAIAGGAVGLVTAKVLGANTNWTIVSTLAGAAVGTMVAQNQATGECAYSNGDGTYRTGRCPS